MMPSPASVRCVRTIQPAKADRRLTFQHVFDAQSHLAGGQPIVVELGWRDFDAEAASLLARLVAAGHPVVIRGKRHENELQELIDQFVVWVPAA
jgi:hypothetical protein